MRMIKDIEFVTEPVISLAIKANGIETPNFSRALDRFQKDDPTLRVHMDAESQEVRHPTLKMSLVSNLTVDHHLWNG